MIINNELAYEVLKEGDALQIIHKCGRQTLICFIDPNSNAETLAWVDSTNVEDNSNKHDKVSKGAHLRLAYTKENGIIDNIQKENVKERNSWTTNRFLPFLFWLERLLLAVSLALAAMLFTL